jgi:DNA-binding NarL/FixJ family response regulator
MLPSAINELAEDDNDGNMGAMAPSCSQPDGWSDPMMDDSPDSTYLKGLTVLYVEDEPETLAQATRFIGRRVGRVLPAANGEEGLAAFRFHRPQMVVTDIRMPGMDGLAMAQTIRELDPSVAVIIITAFEQTEYLEQAIRAGVDQYVVKPVQAERLEFALLSCAHRLRLAASSQHPAAALTAEEAERFEGLTPREREVLALVGRGLPEAEIGAGLGISPRTVHIHVNHLMTKLRLHKASALAAFAVRSGLS